MLSIQLLGPPLILQGDQPLTITRKKSRALLYYVAAHDKPLTREQILSFFWPDSDRVSAQQVLRTTLHGLRQALGTALITDENRLSLAPEIGITKRCAACWTRRWACRPWPKRAPYTTRSSGTKEQRLEISDLETAGNLVSQQRWLQPSAIVSCQPPRHQPSASYPSLAARRNCANYTKLSRLVN